MTREIYIRHSKGGRNSAYWRAARKPAVKRYTGSALRRIVLATVKDAPVSIFDLHDLGVSRLEVYGLVRELVAGGYLRLTHIMDDIIQLPGVVRSTRERMREKVEEQQ